MLLGAFMAIWVTPIAPNTFGKFCFAQTCPLLRDFYKIINKNVFDSCATSDYRGLGDIESARYVVNAVLGC